MPLELPEETRDRLVASIQKFADAELDLDAPMTSLKAAIVLDFVLKEIGPSIYNVAIGDAQKHLGARVEEMSGAVYQAEFGYWKR